jgi:imidazolonepropionase-like amidohydrolase
MSGAAGGHHDRTGRASQPYGIWATANFLALRLRDQLDASAHPGPHIVASGPPITIRAGHCDFLGGVANGVRELRAAVRERTMIEP